MFWLAEKEREIEKDCARVSAQGAESLYVLECVPYKLEAKNDRTLCLRVSECTGETKRECDHSRYLLRRPV